MHLRRLLVPALVAALLLPGSAAVADTAAPVQVTAAVRTAGGGLAFVTERASSRARGLELVQRMRSRAGVVAASVATPVRAFDDDPLRSQQWGLTRLAAERTWAQGPAAGTLVAVLDSGVDAGHPELSAVTVPGVDLVERGDGRTDPNGHGTHVAGIVAAVGGDGVGGAGLAQGARVLPVRVLDADGYGYDSDVAEGIVWAVDHGAKVVNVSLGGERQSSLLTASIDYATSKGVVVVAAAGNEGAAGDPVLYPAASRGVVAVGAVGSDDVRPDWSSSGSHLALAAPGVDILSTIPGSGYESWSGTSMAAPFVASAAALLLTDEPTLTPAEVRARLMATARDLGAPGFDALTGAGMVDVLAARAVSRPEPVVAEPVVAEPVVAEPVVAEPIPPAPVLSEPVVAAPVETPQTATPSPVPAPEVASPAPTESSAPVAAPRTEPVLVTPPSVSVFPAALSAGQRVTVTYRGSPGAVVDVLSRTQPATTFSRIARVTLDSSGTATSSHAPQKNTRITARSASGAVSPTQPLVVVRSVSSLTVQRVGTRTYAFTGRVYPALDRRLISLYRNGVLVAQGRTDASGIYRITKQLAGGTFTFQTRTPNDQHNLGAASPLRRAQIS